MSVSKCFSTVTVCFVFVFLTVGVVSAEDFAIFFHDDFEGADIDDNPRPVWSWETPYSKTSPYGMMYGEGDIYSNKQVNVGGRSSRVLSLNFNGRNGFCNICGSATHFIKDFELREQCFSVNGGPFSNKLFNKDGGFTTWRLTSIDSSKVCFNGEAPIEGSLLGDNFIEPGDELKIPFQCGISGSIGGAEDRRSDCNLAINYLNGIDREHFEPNMTLARRMYLYIPKSTEMPGSGLKLGYTVFQKTGENPVSIIPVILTSRNSSLEVDGNKYFGYKFTDYRFERDKWHYLEEVWTRESREGGFDGTYKLYAGEVGSDTSTPLLSLTEIEYGDIKKLSIIGNWQHKNEAIGSIYIDNVMVANRFIGQGDFKSTDRGDWVSPPDAPQLNVE